MNAILISWLIIAAGAFIGEIVMPQFFLFWFGIGAVSALTSHLLGVAYPYQWAVFVIVSSAGILLTRPFAKTLLKEEPKKSGVYALIGERMKVVKTIDNVEGTGQVEWKGERWQATSEDDTVIEEGAWVKVIHIEGVSLVVQEEVNQKND
jgi:membrane protein implicated in regulation of membrane protease activity